MAYFCIIVVIDRQRRIIQRRQKIRFDITHLGFVSMQGGQDILNVGID